MPLNGDACETLYIPKRAFLDCIEGSFDAAIAMLRTYSTREPPSARRCVSAADNGAIVMRS